MVRGGAEIKGCLYFKDIFITDDLGAAQLWNELDYEVQKLLITAPRYGGPFTTEERKKIKELWEIHTDDLECREKK